MLQTGVSGDTLYELGSKHVNVWALTADTGGWLRAFGKDFPDRFIDVDVAEQSLAAIAAGCYRHHEPSKTRNDGSEWSLC
ncbi:MAG: hypothetical protein HYU86_09220 [Chloroflexi bacterium]|nr:hypothetical protein [Chloroflexota bacterium]